MAQALNQETLQKLFENGALLILLDVPEGTEIGIDMYSWQTGDQFKGIKMIPPGLHFVYFSSCSKENQLSPRTGFFHWFKEREVYVRRWNHSTESFDPQVTDEEELSRFTSNKKDFDKFCGPYPFESYKKWISLTQHMSEDLVKKIQPKNGYIQAAVSLQSESSNSQSRAAQVKKAQLPLEKTTADNLMSHMSEAPETSMHYTCFSRFKEGSTAATITSCAVDASSILEDFISSAGTSKNILGEMEMAFVCFLIGQQFDSFDQWKKIINLLCGCENIITKEETLYTDLINVLHFQLKEMPSDFFIDIVSQNNFLTVTLHNLYMNITESTASQTLKSRVKKFCDHLTNKFGWDFEADPDDDAPVVVDERGNY